MEFPTPDRKGMLAWFIYQAAVFVEKVKQSQMGLNDAEVHMINPV